MRFKIVVLKLSRLGFTQLADLADIVREGFINNATVYGGVSPSTTSAAITINSLRQAIKNWGKKGNRGSHISYEKLLEARADVCLILNQWAAFAENKTPGNRQELTTLGWPLKKLPAVVGKLEPVVNLHQFISRKIDRGTTKLKWSMPLNTQWWQVKVYRVLRGDTSNINQAKQIGMSTRTSFIDENAGTGTKYYFIIPVNSFGDGVPAMVAAAATPVL